MTAVPVAIADTRPQGPRHDVADFEVVSFDLDGTLVDTAGEIAEAVNRTLAGAGLQPLPREQVATMIGAGARVLLQRVLAQVDPGHRHDHARLLSAFELHYAQTAGSTAAAYPGARDCLERLRAAGMRLACVTNKASRHAHRVLDVTGLLDAFDLLAGGDTLAWSKPDGRVLRYVAQVLGSTPGRMVHVGDSATDLAAARNAGVADWAVPWGYNGGRDIARERPSHLCASLPRVADDLLEQRAAPRSG